MKFKEISIYPTVNKDIAVTIDKDVVSTIELQLLGVGETEIDIEFPDFSDYTK